jgi:hypothetical protein
MGCDTTFTMHPACLALASLTLLTGCASLGGLLPFGRGPNPAATAAPMPEHEYQRTVAELAQLRDQQTHFATTLSRVQDPAIRVHHVRNINTLAERIQLLELRLRAAGRPTS